MLRRRNQLSTVTSIHTVHSMHSAPSQKQQFCSAHPPAVAREGGVITAVLCTVATGRLSLRLWRCKAHPASSHAFKALPHNTPPPPLPIFSWTLAAAEEEVKALLEVVEGDRVEVLQGGFAPEAATRKLFKCGDAELKIGSTTDAAVCKGALLQC